MKLLFLLLHHLVQVQLLYNLMSSHTSAASRKPRVVHWPVMILMQRTCKRSTALIVFTNAASWKRTFVEVMYQMSNMQVKAIVLSLVTVVWKPELNATMELRITAEDTCNSPTVFTHFHRKKILDGSPLKPVRLIDAELVLNQPHPGQAACFVLFGKALWIKTDFRVHRDSLYANMMLFIRQIITVIKNRQMRLLKTPLFLPTVSANLILY